MKNYDTFSNYILNLYQQLIYSADINKKIGSLFVQLFVVSDMTICNKLCSMKQHKILKWSWNDEVTWPCMRVRFCAISKCFNVITVFKSTWNDNCYCCHFILYHYRKIQWNSIFLKWHWIKQEQMTLKSFSYSTETWTQKRTIVIRYNPSH